MMTPDLLGPKAYADHLMARYGVKRTRQAIHKHPRLPRQGGKIDVARADAVLVSEGVIPRAALTDGLAEAEQEPGELFTVAADDAVRNEKASANSAAGSTSGQGRQQAPQGKAYYDERAATERVVRRLKELELEERQGRLLRVDDVTEAMVKAGRRIGESLDALTTLADELAAAAKEGGAASVRDVLRRHARKQRETLAEVMQVMADGSLGAEGDDDAE